MDATQAWQAEAAFRKIGRVRCENDDTYLVEAGDQPCNNNFFTAASPAFPSFPIKSAIGKRLKDRSPLGVLQTY